MCCPVGRSPVPMTNPSTHTWLFVAQAEQRSWNCQTSNVSKNAWTSSALDRAGLFVRACFVCWLVFLFACLLVCLSVCLRVCLQACCLTCSFACLCVCCFMGGLVCRFVAFRVSRARLIACLLACFALLACLPANQPGYQHVLRPILSPPRKKRSTLASPAVQRSTACKVSWKTSQLMPESQLSNHGAWVFAILESCYLPRLQSTSTPVLWS